MIIHTWGETIKPLSYSLAGHGWHSGVEIKVSGREGKFALFSSFSLPFLARSTQAIGPLWLPSFSLSNLVWQGGMRRISFGDLSVTKLGYYVP